MPKSRNELRKSVIHCLQSDQQNVCCSTWILQLKSPLYGTRQTQQMFIALSKTCLRHSRHNRFVPSVL